MYDFFLLLIMRFFTVLLFLLFYAEVTGQIIRPDSTDLTFKSTDLSPYDQEYDSTGKVQVSGYIDTYYSYYTDSSGSGGYQKFPTIAPRNNQFGLNIVQISALYHAERFRGIATVFFGDTPNSCWSPEFNMIQEAHVGFRIIKKLWLDAGFFRTHIGLESIQPRENVSSSIAIATYFEPYFLSGAKLTWQQSDAWTFQLNAFNGFNTFIESNSNKVLGFSTSYSPKGKWSATFGTVVCDESDDGSKPDKFRNYNNLITIYKTRRLILGMEVNFGFQQHSKLTDSSATAYVASGLIAAKYRITDHWGIYGRCEIFSDPDEILTGPIVNENHTLTGLDIIGGTAGIEYKPIPNAFFRIEGRYLQTKSTERIFFYNNASRNFRNELIVSFGVWF